MDDTHVARSGNTGLSLWKHDVRNRKEGLSLPGETDMSRHTVISACVSGGIAYVTIRGRVVAGEEAAAVREAVLRCVASDFQLLVVNLRAVDKMDAAGVSVLVFAYSTAQSVGARFRLAAVPPRIKELLAITRLDTIFLPPNSACGVTT
jgi:anti-anti-sigma factor